MKWIVFATGVALGWLLQDVQLAIEIQDRRDADRLNRLRSEGYVLGDKGGVYQFGHVDLDLS